MDEDIIRTDVMPNQVKYHEDIAMSASNIMSAVKDGGTYDLYTFAITDSELKTKYGELERSEKWSWPLGFQRSF